MHTKILSGSLNPDLDLDSAQRKKALEGRVLEVAGKAKLGKGEKTVRTAERNKAARFVREGMVKKQKERNQKELEEVSLQSWRSFWILSNEYTQSGEAAGELPSCTQATL